MFCVGSFNGPPMIGFATLDETRTLGSPIVRLFHVAFGRDPDPSALGAFAERLRAGATVLELAETLVASDEFCREHGAGNIARHKYIEVLRDTAAAAGMSQAEALVAVAESAEARRDIPLLPGLAPGAGVDDPVAYALWIAEYDTPNVSAPSGLAPTPGPCVSMAMAVRETEAEAAIATTRSLALQTYPYWELVIAARLLSPWLKRSLLDAIRDEPRIKMIEAKTVENSADRLALALGLCAGPLAGTLEPGDVLAPTALYEIVTALDDRPDALMLFTDEDRLAGGSRTAPRFKAAWSPEAALAGDAIGQLAIFRAPLVAEAGGLRAAAWPYHVADLAARAAAVAGCDRVQHLPAVLVHRRERQEPAPPYVAVPPIRLAEPAPLVSIIVTSRDHAALLETCTSGVLQGTRYPALELIVVDNGSAEADALALLSRLEATSGVRVLRWPAAFNFAAMNNFAAAQAAGDILLLLNNDVEILAPDWLSDMVAHVLRPDVGAVGAKLLYADDTVQHAGLLLGPGGRATHVGRGAPRDEPGYLGQLAVTRELAAVTGACLAIRTEVWRTVGGMDERLAVTWNDVDLCLRVRAAGLRVIWSADAVLRHHEGATRLADAADAARQARFHAEQALAVEIWGDDFGGDPFLNANLTAEDSGHLALTKPRRQRPWEAVLF